MFPNCSLLFRKSFETSDGGKFAHTSTGVGYAILNSRRAIFLAIEFSKSVAGKLRDCGKLLKPNRGEVAERLNAAVC